MYTSYYITFLRRSVVFIAASFTLCIRTGEMPTSYDYSKSTYFANGIQLDYLQTLVLQQISSPVCQQITLVADVVSFIFQSALSPEQVVTLDNIVLTYINPTQSPIVLSTNDNTASAFMVQTTGENSGITFTTGTSGITGHTTGPFQFTADSTITRAMRGKWFSAPILDLGDADAVLTPLNLTSSTLLASPSVERTFTLPDAVDMVSCTQWLTINDSFETFIVNVGSAAFTLSLGSGVICVGSPTCAAGSTKQIRVVITNVDVGSEAYTVICKT